MLFDSNQCIRRYTNVEDILKEFFELRKEYYNKRKEFLEGMISAESLKLDNQARFIMEKIEGTITIGELIFFCILRFFYIQEDIRGTIKGLNTSPYFFLISGKFHNSS